MTCGFVAAVTDGTRSTPGEFAPPASISGLQPSASSAAAGRRTRIGIRNDALTLALDRTVGTSFEPEARLLLHLGSKLRTVARAETTGYALAFRHAADSQPIGRLR